MTKTIFRGILFLIVGIGFTVNLSWAELRYMDPYPFQIGEEITWSVKMLGTHLGTQYANIVSETAFDGYQLIEGYANVESTPFVSAFYDLDDSENNYFFPEDLTPYYTEKWIQEGSWVDHMIYEFDPESGEITITTEQAGGVLTELTAPLEIHNYFTMVLVARSLDYDYYIENNQTFELSYLLKQQVVTSTLQAEYDSYRYNRENVDVIKITDLDGIGLEFIVSDDQHRKPLYFKMPSDPSTGKGVNMKATLESFSEGNQLIYQN